MKTLIIVSLLCAGCMDGNAQALIAQKAMEDCRANGGVSVVFANAAQVHVQCSKAKP